MIELVNTVNYSGFTEKYKHTFYPVDEFHAAFRLGVDYFQNKELKDKLSDITIEDGGIEVDGKHVHLETSDETYDGVAATDYEAQLFAKAFKAGVDGAYNWNYSETLDDTLLECVKEYTVKAIPDYGYAEIAPGVYIEPGIKFSDEEDYSEYSYIAHDNEGNFFGGFDTIDDAIDELYDEIHVDNDEEGSDDE